MIEGAPLQKLLIVGAGGSGREVAWLARDVHGEQIGLMFVVESRYLDTNTVNGVPVIAFDSLSRDRSHYIVAVGDIVTRRRLVAECEARKLTAVTLVHPAVARSNLVDIGIGSIVCAGAIITTNVRIGRHVHINIGCTLSHDVMLGDFATLSPGVHISGHVHVGEGVLIGTGANIINGKSGTPLVIGDGAVIAAGACVIRDVEAGATVAGVPALSKP
ncbi:acetyltransferase [Luteimonas kalidii]|uniref:Acetyltransferase n=1 Tax=Luteimonas kalidii TaxID=3042025 RepID=A0ABT6JQS1_9GAMM|nr:acetyltransferase [Luteimonas kalidii]MDH5833036.1 acetyltransferase [Luteimonas kalidii]